VVKGLWDSWEEDAFIRDKTTGQFFDPQKLHTLNHHGDFFQVAGPLNIGRTPQGRPIIFQAGASDDGKKLAARHADAIFTHHDTLDEAKHFYRDVKAQLIKNGRREDELHIFQGVSVIVGDNAQDVEQQYQTTAALVSIQDALNYLGRYFEHHDFSQYPLDEPFPDIGTWDKTAFAVPPMKSNAMPASATDAAPGGAGSGLTASAFFRHPGAGSGRPATVVRRAGSRRFYYSGRHAGYLPTLCRHRSADFAGSRLFRKAYPGTTLRESLGLQQPANQFSQ
jgi:alkanesulfonate monooxygenase SsuD/methylene tetrahydromethanopterin reductase-like flavin-dependent oxidoreductase (luciferase family)